MSRLFLGHKREGWEDFETEVFDKGGSSRASLCVCALWREQGIDNPGVSNGG